MQPAAVARLERILGDLQHELHLHNPYARTLKHLCDVQHQSAGLRLALSEKDLPANSTRRYTSHNSPEVALLVDDGGPDEQPVATKRDIVITMQGGGVRRIEDTHRAADPLYFVLMHSTGQPGWRLGLSNTAGRRITTDKYYKFLMFRRAGHSTTHLRCQRLWQEWCCLQFQKSENQRLKYFSSADGQKKIRADLYKNLADSVRRGDAPGEVGKRVILAPTFVGGPRYQHALFQDAMAVVRAFTKPDLFITFTCNPTWDEISDALEAGNTWRSQPELVSRVFHLKLKAMMQELTKDGIFGQRVAHFQVIEFQKRGLPHAHILLILHQNHRLRTAEDIDTCITAELPPDPEGFPVGWQRDQAQDLQDIITTNMIHGPCGHLNPGAPCMYNREGQQVDACQKKYPMPYQTTTTCDTCRRHTHPVGRWEEDAPFPRYRRRQPEDGGRRIPMESGR
jgi:hypothetical protein